MSRRNEAAEPIAGRVPASLRQQLEVIAQLEDDTISSLILEGVARVVEARSSDPNYISRHQDAVTARITELQQQQDVLSHLVTPTE
jgi:hypothetical protein